MLEKELKKGNKKIIFKKKPQAISANFRPIYVISQILLIIKYCARSSKASLIQIHTIFHIMNSTKNMIEVEENIENLKFIGIERNPIINRALNYAINDGLIIQEKNRYLLTKKSEEFLLLIEEDKKLLKKEKKFVKKIKKKISLNYIEQIMKEWSE